MKYLFTTILSLGFYLVSNAQKLQDLAAFFKTKNNCPKEITAKTYTTRDGFCSNSIILNSDSTFMKEGGCEGRSSICMGKWRLFSDSIELTAFKQSEIDIVCGISSTDNPQDSTVTFIFTEKTGNKLPFTQFIKTNIRSEREKNGHYDHKNPPRTLDLMTDNNGELIMDRDVDLADLDFFKFAIITGKPCNIPFGNLPSRIHIQLNVNQIGLVYSDLQYEYFDTPIQFKYTKEALIYEDYILKYAKPD